MIGQCMCSMIRDCPLLTARGVRDWLRTLNILQTYREVLNVSQTQKGMLNLSQTYNKTGISVVLQFLVAHLSLVNLS